MMCSSPCWCKCPLNSPMQSNHFGEPLCAKKTCSGQRSAPGNHAHMESRTSCTMVRVLVTSLGHHHLHELLVVDLPVTIHVSLTNHLVHFLVGELLAQVRHDVPQLCGADEAVPITIENLEG